MTAPRSRPQRLHLSRAKGFRLQAWSRELNGRSAVHCARPGKLGNPFIVGKHGTPAICVEMHARLMSGLLAISVDRECVEAQKAHLRYVIANRARLKGKNCACWCSFDGPCHANTLLDVFNRRRGR